MCIDLSFVECLRNWQELIGATAGAFLAGFFSVLILFFTRWLDKYDLRIEHMRRIEISLARALNEMHWVQMTVNLAVSELRDFAVECRSIHDDKTYFISRFSFPPLREIYVDEESPTYRLKSYYLHNKLLWIESGIRDTNRTLATLKDEFTNMTAMSTSEWALKNSPHKQRETYADNIDSFADMIGKYANDYLNEGIKLTSQAKTYNNIIRARFGWFFRWQYEGISFKYFRNKAEIIKYSQDLQMLERIDRLIDKRVLGDMESANQRKSKSEQQR